MAAVPSFDMEPGVRLKALREVPVDVGNLMGASHAATADRRRSSRCATS